MIEVLFCIGPVTCFVPESATPYLTAGQQYQTREYKKAICDLATTNSYRMACVEFDKRYNRTGDNCIKRTTFVKHMTDCGKELIRVKDKIAAETIESFGFNPDTLEYLNGELPENLHSRKAEFITVTATDEIRMFPSDEWDPENPEMEIPQEYLYSFRCQTRNCNHSEKSTDVITHEDEYEETSRKEVPSKEDIHEGTLKTEHQSAGDGQTTTVAKEQKYSVPDNDTTPYVKKRRGKRTEVEPERKQYTVDDYLRWRNSNLKSPISKILYRWTLEKDSRQVVYISSDADLVPKQSEKHVAGGKAERRSKKDNVVHWNIKVEWDDRSYGITGTRESVYHQLCAFLLTNNLITRYMVFYTDGETCIFEDIDRYFFNWDHVIYIDYFHLMHKTHELLSQAIKHIKVIDPKGPTIYYKIGPKKGQVKKSTEVFLSRLYARVVSSALFAGNWKEAILYLRDIDPKHVAKAEPLDELINYLWRKRHYITCTALRKKTGLRNSSNGSESVNNQYVSDLQKGKNKNWRDSGSYSVATLTCCFKNGQEDAWFYHDEFSFKLD